MLRAIRNLYSPQGEGYLSSGQEVTVDAARARQIPTSVAELVPVTPPGDLPPMETRPAPGMDDGGPPVQIRRHRLAARNHRRQT